MRDHIKLASIVGTFGLLVAANVMAQTYSAARGAFDGTYRLVSSQNLTPTYVTRQGGTRSCPETSAGPLTIAQGQASYTTGSGRQLAGTVNPQGEIAMRLTQPGEGRTLEVQVGGTVDGVGTARAHQRGNSCSYYFTWQKQ